MTDQNALENLGIMLQKNGSAVFGFDENTFMSIYRLGHGYFEAQNFKKAKEVFKALTLAFPLNKPAIHAYGTTCYLLKELDLALRAFKVYQLLSEDDHQGHLYEGYVHIELGDIANARPALEKALSLAQKNSEIYSKIQLILEQIGRS
jgi:tetratricopeptide (TPR) repeat protein